MNIDEFLEHPEEKIRELALRIKELQESVQRGLLTHGEYNELCDDLLDVSAVLRDNKKIIKKVRVEQALTHLIALARVLPR